MKRLAALAAALFGCGLGAALAFVWALARDADSDVEWWSR